MKIPKKLKIKGIEFDVKFEDLGDRIFGDFVEIPPEIRINSKRIHDRKELIENIPCILFSPEDLSLIKGPPECRRWFFNQTLSLFDITFIDLLRDYKRVLKSRNILLKQENSLKS